MLEEFRSLDGAAFEHITTEWNDKNQLGVAEYHAVLRDSIFVPCPSGWGGAVGLKDCFRLYETLEAGSIPIIEHDDYEYFDKFYPGHPFLKAPSDWKGVARDIRSLLEDRLTLQIYNYEVLAWWKNYKKSLKKEMRQRFSPPQERSLAVVIQSCDKYEFL